MHWNQILNLYKGTVVCDKVFIEEKDKGRNPFQKSKVVSYHKTKCLHLEQL